MQISGRLAGCSLKAPCPDVRLCPQTHRADTPGLKQVHTLLYLIFLSKRLDADIFPMLNHEAGQCFFQLLSLYSCKTSNGLNGMIKGSRTGAKKGNMPREKRCLQ